MKETKSSKVLADYAQEQGFRVTRGVAEIPTAFIAEYGSGLPIIGVLGEFDVTWTFSKAQTTKRF
jgi:aminobenzoyl-glutamate utilization protein B